MTVMMLMATNAKIMGVFAVSGWIRVLGWLATAVMALSAAGLFATFGR